MAEAPLPPVLRVEDVVKNYGTTVVTPVLRGVTFDVHAGEFAALIGPSGSGDVHGVELADFLAHAALDALGRVDHVQLLALAG